MDQARKLFSIVLVGFAIFFAAGAVMAHAATITWTASGPGTWTTPGNWSTGAVPTSADTVIFSASSTQNCTLNGAFPNYNSAAGVTITSGYTGTITQNLQSQVNIGSSGWSQAGGTFTGSASSSANDQIIMNGPFSLTAGTFTSTNGILYLNNGSDTFSSGFAGNSGIVDFDATSTQNLLTGSTTFNQLYIGNTGYSGFEFYFTVATGTIISVASTTSFDNTYGQNIYFGGGGELNALGSVLLFNPESNAYIFPTSSFNFVLGGTGTQTVSDQGNDSLLFTQYFNFPSLTINKSSGVVNLVGDIGILGNFTNNNGTSILNPGTSTVVFIGAASSTAVTTTINGSTTFNNLFFGTGTFNSAQSTFVVATGTTLNAQNELYINAQGSPGNSVGLLLSGGGTIATQGNIEYTGAAPFYEADTVSILMNGTSTQTIGDTTACTATGGCNGLFLPNVTITKTSGSVTLLGTLDFGGNFTNTNATTINPGSSTVLFGAGLVTGYGFPSSTNLAYTINGTSTFYNLLIGDYSGTNDTIMTVATGTTVTVQNEFGIFHTQNGNYDQFLGSGQINIAGNIETEPFIAPSYPTSTASIVLNGTSTQIIGDPTLCGGNCGTPNPPDDFVGLPNLTIAKSAGTAYVENGITIGGATTISQGELDLATGTTYDSATFDGPITINSGARLSNYAQATSTIELTSSVTNNGTVFFDGTGESCGTTIPSEIVLGAQNSSLVTWSGTGTTIMRFVNFSYQTSTPPVAVWNGANGGHTDWTVTTQPVPQLIQSVASTSGSGTSQITLSPFAFYPRSGDFIAVAESVRNQTLVAPTDSASNTYVLATSTSFGSSPSYAVGLYYAKNVMTTSSFAVTLHGGGGSGNYLSGAAYDYTGVAPSTTVQSLSEDSGLNTTAITSLSANGQYSEELYLGAMTFDASTTASSEAGWNSELGISDTTKQVLYTEDIATATIMSNVAATWTPGTSTDFGAVLGIFNAPYLPGFQTSGLLDSATFDTGVVSGAQLNSVTWQGSLPSGTHVGFQFAVSNSSSGPWNFVGPTGDGTQFFGYNNTAANTPIPLSYTYFSGYRYFRYRVELVANATFTQSPVVNQVTVNWSP